MELDRWLEDHAVDWTPTRRSRAREWIGQPVDWARNFAVFTRTTPGTMFILTLIITLLLLIGGIGQFESASARRADIAELSSVTEPVAFSAHNLYTSLSVADTQAMGALVQQNADAAGFRDALHAASLAATESAAGTAGTAATDADTTVVDIGTVSMYLPVYAGLIEAGRSLDRMDNPLGSAYLGQASTLMRERMMPAADSLFTATSQRVITQQQAATRPHVVALGVLAVALVVLVLTQMWLYHLTRRRLNAGFLAATALVGVALVWGSVVQVVAWTAGTGDISAYTALTDARVTAQRVRADEMLGLVRRADLTGVSTQFDAAVDSVSQTLTTLGAPAEAQTALEEWSDDHKRAVDAALSGDYAQATAIMTVDSATPVATVDAVLEGLIDTSRAEARDTITTAYRANFLLGTGTLALCIIAALALWIGVRPRLQEYL